MSTTPLNVLRVANSKDSLLLSKLPGELRNKIYRLVLLDQYIQVDFKAIYANTTLLRTSSQIREEANSVYYHENTFCITNAEAQQPDLVKLLACMNAEDKAKVGSFHYVPQIPPRTSKAINIMNSDLRFGVTAPESATILVRDLDLPPESTFEDVLAITFHDPLGSVIQTAKTLIESGVPITRVSCVRSMPNNDPQRWGKDIKGESEKQILVAMGQTFMEAVADAHYRVYAPTEDRAQLVREAMNADSTMDLYVGNEEARAGRVKQS